MTPIRLFPPPEEAIFVERPNRFLVRCRYRGRTINAHLPNPGRLQELLLPDARLLIIAGKGKHRKNAHTAVAVKKEGRTIMLHTHRSNTAAEALIERNAIRGLSGATIIRREVAAGNSRFDFLLRYHGQELYLEVKSCTLFGKTVAMFPDAITVRGARHLAELSQLNSQGKQVAVLFMVHSPDLQYFMPDYHTDLHFARTLLSVRPSVRFIPVAVNWEQDLTLRAENTRLTIPWSYLKKEVHDRGSYLLLLRLEKEKEVVIGNLGARRFVRGYYVYVGSAMSNLRKRIERHRRLRKNMHWHIDYLRAATQVHAALAIRSSDRLECSLAGAVASLAPRLVKKFGCSDCACESHLFGFTTDPLKLPAFQEMLIHFRMDRFEG
jgi:sugar fermentation stimulation protein A